MFPPTTNSPGTTIPPVSGGPTATAWPPQVQLSGTLANAGTAAGCNVQIALWHLAPTGERTRIETRTLPMLAAGATETLTFQWQPPTLAPGYSSLYSAQHSRQWCAGLPRPSRSNISAPRAGTGRRPQSSSALGALAAITVDGFLVAAKNSRKAGTPW
ncbi:MAG: CARDB domain-containing protein [Caldilineaceae bacterium]